MYDSVKWMVWRSLTLLDAGYPIIAITVAVAAIRGRPNGTLPNLAIE